MSKLHITYGLNPTIERCQYCELEGAMVLLGDNVPGKAPDEIKIACMGRCEGVGITVLVEVDDKGETGYSVIGPAGDFKKINGGKAGKHSMSVQKMKNLMGKLYRTPGNVEIHENQD